MRPEEIRARRALERLAGEITGLRDSHDALARATQLRWSTVPVVDEDGNTVEVPVTDLMQDSATAVVDLDVVKVDLALAEAAVIAAGQAAAAAKQQAEQLEGALTPLKNEWDEFYGVGGKTLEQVLTEIQAAQASADGAIRTHYGPNPPWANGTTQPDSVQGDMWLGTDDAIAYRWIGTTWEIIPDAGLADALREARAAALAAAQAQLDADAAAGVAEAAQTLAGDTADDLLVLAGKTGRLIRSTTAPTGDDKNVNNLWLNTSTGQLNQLVGTTWTVITDSRLTNVINRADAAWNLADGAAEAAGNAESLANAAQTAANNANTAAGEAAAAALAAQGAAEAAQSTASSAASAAQAAQGTADAAAQAALDAAGIAGEAGRVWAQPTAPPSGTDDARANDLWINTLNGANTPMRWDSTLDDWVEVTDAVAKKAAADVILAQQKADDAFTNAGQANDRAATLEAQMLLRISEIGTLTGSVSTASGKYTVAAANPTASDAAGKSLNSVWEVRSGSTTLRRYVLTGTSTWTQVAIGRDMVGVDAIGNAQIGNLAVGTAELADAAVTNLKFGDAHGGKLWAGSVSTDKLIVEPGNLFPDPLFRDGGDPASGVAAGWPATGNAKRVVDPTFGGGYALEIQHPTAAQSGAFYKGTAPLVQLEPGERYRVRAMYQTYASIGAKIALRVRTWNSAGAATDTYAILAPPVGAAEAANSRKMYEATFTVPATAVGLAAVGFYSQPTYLAGRTVRIGDVHLIPTVGGTMITPEGIFANHLHASVGEDLVLTGNAVIIETQGAAQGAQTTATQALEALAPLSEVPGVLEGLDAGVTEAQRLANLGIGDAEAADTKAADAKTLADAAQKVADTAAEDIREQKKRFSFGEDGLIITDEGYSSAITIDNEGITMSQNGNPVSSWIGGTFSADIVEADVFRVGMHQWQKYPLEEGATVTGTVIKTVVT